jgi:hypothetical protein
LKDDKTNAQSLGRARGAKPWRFGTEFAITVGPPTGEEAMRFYQNRTWKRLVVGLLAIVLIECSAALLCRLLLFVPLPLIWHPDLTLARENWIAFISDVDPEIGGYRVYRAKPNSEFPSAPSCGSAFGDSYVGGAEVAGDLGWVEQLSHLLGCRVANYSVGNYGTDQAYLHFRRVHDNSPFVILGINPNTVQDNVNQYDALLGSALVPTALKGRFLFDPSGQLEWLLLPSLDESGFVALNRNPGKKLPNSYFLPDTRDGPVSLRFPFTITLARIALMPRLHDLFARRADWSAMYAAGHPSGALRLMTAICEAFAESAKARGQRPLIVLLPISASFRERLNHGQFEYAPLVSALQTKNIDAYDAGPAMIDSLTGRSPCEFFIHVHHNYNPLKAWLTSPVPCGGHYSVAANTTIAHLVAEELRRRNFIVK